MADRFRIDGMNHTRRDRCRKAVQNDGDSLMPRGDNGTDTRCQLPSPKAAQRFQRVRKVTAVQGQRPADEVNPLAGKGCCRLAAGADPVIR